MLTVYRMTAAQHYGKSVVLWGTNLGTAPPIKKMGPWSQLAHHTANTAVSM